MTTVQRMQKAMKRMLLPRMVQPLRRTEGQQMQQTRMQPLQGTRLPAVRRREPSRCP